MNSFIKKCFSGLSSPTRGQGVFLLLFVTQLHAQNIVTDKKEAGAFALVSADQSATVLVDENDDSLVQKAAQWLAKDVEMVTGKKPNARTSVSSAKNIIVIGNIQKSKFIQQLIKEKKLHADKLQNKWEAYQIEVIKAPFKGIEQALVIAGSDRRGTAYGVFELSKQMGVSPWGWWADVPVKKKKEIYVKANTFLSDAPKVKYRGIFINDEAPALSGWSKEKFGGFNHQFYEKVFELILRLKGNYLWPAMWGNAFYDDDPLNKQTADTYGIVIGTSHHEPLMRAHDEWRRYGKGKWNYDSNAVQLQQFWKEGMQRATNEKIVSIGMRGDGDEPMTQGTAIALLERIVADQRKIIEAVTGKPAAATPQLWALYKEVQDYYDKGMRVPDDVTLLLCDDNWGNIRKLPKLTDQPRTGGYGIYYHFDYVGGPRNYKWINTNNIARVWEQMHLAYEH
ncbi:MAG: glycosyl hydrolase 115 family protein, partial [Flavisolibacter sp.]|nr:glycosyl hydrolase 115 family protein [Flavisolibacter sp.]